MKQIEELKQTYLESVLLIERLHRRFLEVVKTHLDILKFEDINNIQVLILYNIGDEKLTVGELTQRGYYLGSNVSYNVKKLVEAGYLEQSQAVHDKRSSKVNLTQKGQSLCKEMDKFYTENSIDLLNQGVMHTTLKDANKTLLRLEGFWEKTIYEMGRKF